MTVIMVDFLRGYMFFFFFQAEDGIRDHCVTGVQTCALPICCALNSIPKMPEALTVMFPPRKSSELAVMSLFSLGMATKLSVLMLMLPPGMLLPLALVEMLLPFRNTIRGDRKLILPPPPEVSARILP